MGGDFKMTVMKNISASTVNSQQLWDFYYKRRVEVDLKKWYAKYRSIFLFLFSFGMGASAMFFLASADSRQDELQILPNINAVAMSTAEELPQLSAESLYAEIVKQGIAYPKVVLAQGQLESALLTAGSSKKTNNLFGMRFPSVRPTAAIGIYLQGKDSIIYGTQKELRKYLKRPTYAVYAHWTDAVADYKMWQDYSFKARSKYIDFLSRVYATAPNYAEEIRKMVD